MRLACVTGDRRSISCFIIGIIASIVIKHCDYKAAYLLYQDPKKLSDRCSGKCIRKRKLCVLIYFPVCTMYIPLSPARSICLTSSNNFPSRLSPYILYSSSELFVGCWFINPIKMGCNLYQVASVSDVALVS
jgi:hypothetical protein